MAMAEKCICSLENIEVRRGKHIILKDIQLNIEEPVIMSFISEDDSASILLKAIAGLCNVSKGAIKYPALQIKRISELPGWVQYVPDDIICYTKMKVREFLHGVALTRYGRGTEEEGLRFCEMFEIEPEEQLLDLTFEQNRLVAMIQAMMIKPKVLLLDHPNDMLSAKVYQKLLKELETLRESGTSILIAADAFQNIEIPCDKYLFFKDGEIFANYNRQELPHPSKVITLDGGSLISMENDKMRILFQTEERCGFLYKEEDVAELVACIYLSGCQSFSVNALSMEEEIFGNFERWQQ